MPFSDRFGCSQEYEPYCTAVMQTDPNLNKLVYKMVPRKCTEKEFWRLFFCNFYVALREACASTVLTKGMQASFLASVEL